MQPNGHTELTPAQQKLMGQFASANDILFERTNSGLRLVIDFGLQNTPGIKISVPDFSQAITGLIAPNVDPAKVSRVLMKRVSPPSEFSSPTSFPIQLFRIEAYDASKNKIGGDGIKNCPEAAATLAARLQVA